MTIRSLILDVTEKLIFRKQSRRRNNFQTEELSFAVNRMWMCILLPKWIVMSSTAEAWLTLYYCMNWLAMGVWTGVFWKNILMQCWSLWSVEVWAICHQEDITLSIWTSATEVAAWEINNSANILPPNFSALFTASIDTQRNKRIIPGAFMSEGRWNGYCIK